MINHTYHVWKRVEIKLNFKMCSVYYENKSDTHTSHSHLSPFYMECRVVDTFIKTFVVQIHPKTRHQ